MNGIRYVYSTLTASNLYTNWQQGANDVPQSVGSVFIAGGAGVADKYARTPKGVVTEITDEDYEILRANDDFKLHEKNGFVIVSDVFENPNDVADAELKARDGGAPLQPPALAAIGGPGQLVDGEGKAVPTVSTSSDEPPVVKAKSADAAAASKK